MFDNKTKDEKKLEDQTAELLRMVDDLVAQNGGEPYSNALLKEAQVRSTVDDNPTQIIEAPTDIDQLFQINVVCMFGDDNIRKV